MMLVPVSVFERQFGWIAPLANGGAILDKLLCPGALSLQRRFNTLD